MDAKWLLWYIFILLKYAFGKVVLKLFSTEIFPAFFTGTRGSDQESHVVTVERMAGKVRAASISGSSPSTSM